MTGKSVAFLTELKSRLSHLPDHEVDKILGYYSESIQDKLEDGIEEDKIIADFGNINEIVLDIKDEISLGTLVKDKVKSKTKFNMTEKEKILTIIIIILTSPIWLGIGISIGALLFALIITIYAIVLIAPIIVGSLYFSTGVIAIAGIFVGVIRMFTMDFYTGLAYFSIGLISAGILIIFFQPVTNFFKWFVKINVCAFKKIKQFIIKKINQLI